MIFMTPKTWADFVVLIWYLQKIWTVTTHDFYDSWNMGRLCLFDWIFAINLTQSQMWAAPQLWAASCCPVWSVTEQTVQVRETFSHSWKLSNCENFDWTWLSWISTFLTKVPQRTAHHFHIPIPILLERTWCNNVCIMHWTWSPIEWWITWIKNIQTSKFQWEIDGLLICKYYYRTGLETSVGIFFSISSEK